MEKSEYEYFEDGSSKYFEVNKKRKIASKHRELVSVPVEEFNINTDDYSKSKMKVEIVEYEIKC